jgi:hypothetical protein
MLVELSDDEDYGTDDGDDATADTYTSEMDSRIKDLIEWVTAKWVVYIYVWLCVYMYGRGSMVCGSN